MHFAPTHRSSHRRFVATLVLVLGGFALAAGCEKQQDKRTEPAETEQAPESRRAALIFPKSLRVEEAPVNALLEKAMRLCSEGDYENFRMIWTARQEPISRGEFLKGWAAMQQIRIRALERVALATPIGGQADADAGREAAPEIVYVAYAEMTLDPKQLGRAKHRPGAGSSDATADARREAVLMIVKELGDWRLAQAPKSMRSWVRKKLAAAPPDTTNP